MDSSLIALTICVLIGAALLIPMLLARRRAPEEQGLVPAFETYCSGRGTNIPMFRLSIYEGFLVVAFLKPTVILGPRRLSDVVSRPLNFTVRTHP